MNRTAILFIVSLCAVPATTLAQHSAASTQPPEIYFPERFDWQHKKPEAVGMDSARLDEAVKLAVADENPGPRNMAIYLATTFGAAEPFGTPIGPVKDAGGPAGVVLRHGYLVAEWGNPERVDMTFSVTKTFLTTLVGLA